MEDIQNGPSVNAPYSFVAALLEAGGDALVRKGLPRLYGLRKIRFLPVRRIGFIRVWLCCEFAPLGLRPSLGVYVVFFFVAVQLISYVVFQQVPSRTVLIGGLFIIIGGAIVSVGSTG